MSSSDDKAVALAVVVVTLKTAALALREAERLVQESEGFISADFRFLERQEGAVVRVQQAVEQYRKGLPAVHPWFLAKEPDPEQHTR